MNKFLESVSAFLSPAQAEDVIAYRSTIPQTIDVSIKYNSGVFIATIDSIDDKDIKGLLITEAPTFDKIVDNVNDLLFTYLNMPTKIRPFYARILQPVNNTKHSGQLTLVKA